MTDLAPPATPTRTPRQLYEQRRWDQLNEVCKFIPFNHYVELLKLLEADCHLRDRIEHYEEAGSGELAHSLDARDKLLMRCVDLGVSSICIDTAAHLVANLREAVKP